MRAQNMFDFSQTYYIDPNLPAPMIPTCMGLPASSRTASLVERLVILSSFEIGHCLGNRGEMVPYQVQGASRAADTNVISVKLSITILSPASVWFTPQMHHDAAGLELTNFYRTGLRVPNHHRGLPYGLADAVVISAFDTLTAFFEARNLLNERVCGVVSAFRCCCQKLSATRFVVR